MKPQSPEAFLAKVRERYGERVPEEGALPLPPGFADRVVANLAKREKVSRTLVLWERASYAGVALTACVAVAAWMTGHTVDVDTEVMAGAADPWLEMEMLEIRSHEG